jgi:hypothetical protein
MQRKSSLPCYFSSSSIVLLSALAGLLGLSISTTASASDLPDGKHFGVFEILEGQGVELCEACFTALEALPSDLTGCERYYNAIGFSEADWTELEPLEHLSLLKRVMMFVQPIDRSRGIEGTIYEGDNFRREIVNQLKYGGLGLSLAMIDIDNDGRLELVLKFRKGSCINHHDPFHVQYQSLVVLQTDRATIDRRKTDLVMQNPSKHKDLLAGYASDRLYDAFQYQGRVYFDAWDFEERNSAGSHSIESFIVYQAVGKTVTPLCKYRYDRRYR